MKKILVIERCSHCPYLQGRTTHSGGWRGWIGDFCIYDHPGQVLVDIATVPKWCPLPDYDEGQEKKEKK